MVPTVTNLWTNITLYRRFLIYLVQEFDKIGELKVGNTVVGFFFQKRYNIESRMETRSISKKSPKPTNITLYFSVKKSRPDRTILGRTMEFLDLKERRYSLCQLI